jgi:eukaryotic-like serine/threonine-protein kinase
MNMAAPEAELANTLVKQIDWVPGYELLEQVGAGAVGTVYRARQIKLDRIVALKIINRDKLDDPCFALRFEIEAKALARFHHANIVQVYDYGREEDCLFIAMEFLEGKDLYQRIRRQGPLDERLAWAVARQTASALGHAARQGVVHRDIKPANLFMVRPEPGLGTPQDLSLVKVADFGMARIRHNVNDLSSSASGSGLVLGTPLYMAPEQFRTPGKVDHRADIYALGATIYHALTGHPPHGGASSWDVMVEKLERAPEFGSDISSESAALIRAMMEVDPANRVGAYGELINRIDSLQFKRGTFHVEHGGEREQTRAVGTKRRLGRRLALAVALMAAIAGVFRLGWLPAGQATQAHEREFMSTGNQFFLFDQQSLQGWRPTVDGGMWSIEKDKEGVSVLAGTGFVRREFTPLQDYRLTVGLDVHEADAVELHFAIPQHPTESAGRLVLHVSRKNGALLGIRKGARGAFSALGGPVPFPLADWFKGRTPYLEVRCVKEGSTWSAWFHGREVGRVDAGQGPHLAEIQICGDSGAARIDSAVLERLERASP